MIILTEVLKFPNYSFNNDRYDTIYWASVDTVNGGDKQAHHLYFIVAIK